MLKDARHAHPLDKPEMSVAIGGMVVGARGRAKAKELEKQIMANSKKNASSSAFAQRKSLMVAHGL